MDEHEVELIILQTRKIDMLPIKRWMFAVAISIIASPTFITSTLTVVTAQEADNKAYITAENKLVVADEMAIRQVIARLNHALDASDYPLYASFFAEEAVFTSDFGNANGSEKIVLALEASRPLITNKRHVAANLVISGVGDQAKVTSYLVVFERAESLTYVGSAINIDTLEKRDGQWVVVRHESELDPATLKAIQSAMKAEKAQ